MEDETATIHRYLNTISAEPDQRERIPIVIAMYRYLLDHAQWVREHDHLRSVVYVKCLELSGVHLVQESLELMVLLDRAVVMFANEKDETHDDNPNEKALYCGAGVVLVLSCIIAGFCFFVGQIPHL